MSTRRSLAGCECAEREGCRNVLPAAAQRWTQALIGLRLSLQAMKGFRNDVLSVGLSKTGEAGG